MQKFHVALMPRHPKCEVTFFMASSSEDCHNLPHTPLRTKLGHSYVYLDKTVFISCKSFNHIELVRVLIKKIKIYKPQYSAYSDKRHHSVLLPKFSQSYSLRGLVFRKTSRPSQRQDVLWPSR